MHEFVTVISAVLAYSNRDIGRDGTSDARRTRLMSDPLFWLGISDLNSICKIGFAGCRVNKTRRFE